VEEVFGIKDLNRKRFGHRKNPDSLQFKVGGVRNIGICEQYKYITGFVCFIVISLIFVNQLKNRTALARGKSRNKPLHTEPRAARVLKSISFAAAG